MQNSNEFTKNNWSYFLNIYAEQDSKNQSLQQELNQADRDLLSNIGDQLDLLYKDMLAGKGDSTGEWFKSIKAVKDANPKEE